MKQDDIPILSTSEKEKIFFDRTVDWKPPFPTRHQKFHINRLEDAVHHLRFPFPPHRQTVYDFIFITNGKSIRSKGMDSYHFSKNTFFFLPAYQISTHESMSKNVKGYYCHFDTEIFNRKYLTQNAIAEFSFLQFSGNPIVKINPAIQSLIIHTLSRLEQENTKGLKINLDIISIYLMSLFIELKPFAKQEKITENAAFRITQLYKNKLSESIYEKHTISEYASMLNVSPNHLNKCIKAATGKSAQDLLSDMILMEAKVLLRQSTMTVNEIAWKVGKEDTSDFIRFFKSKTKQTPVEFRKMD